MRPPKLLGGEYKLSDFSIALPSRFELYWAQKRFLWLRKHGNDKKWNSEHYYLVDRFFLGMPLSEHYRVYIRTATPKMANEMRGVLLNQMVLLYLYYLEAPQQCNHQSLVPLGRGLGMWLKVFIRKFLGFQKYGKYNMAEIKLLLSPKNEEFKWRADKKFMLARMNAIHNIIHTRALEIQPHFKRQVMSTDTQNYIYEMMRKYPSKN